MKMSMEEQEALLEIVSNKEALRALWKQAEEALSLIQRGVINFQLSENNSQEFLLKKARAEGAASFLSALRGRLEKTIAQSE